MSYQKPMKRQETLQYFSASKIKVILFVVCLIVVYLLRKPNW
jgi:hypothetical protein